VSSTTRDRTSGAADLLALAFGVTVAMWAVGYVGRLPTVMAPSTLIGVLLVGLLAAGGFLAGRVTNRGWLGGAAVGFLSGSINLLVLGSLVAGERPNEVAPSAFLWIPGFLLASATLGACGATLGSRGTSRRLDSAVWVGIFARVAVGATLLLLAVGGLVTSKGVGLAVVDWPNSYGYNMFLFPLSRMTGGIYYEHAHRLFGALVGLTTIVLAVLLQRSDDRGWVRRLGWSAVALVVVQGILGGLRVTGRFTLETERLEPNITLAVIHGVLGQVFLGALVALAVFTSRGWKEASPVERRPARLDRAVCVTLVGLLVAQIALGAVQRHLDRGLTLHIVMAVVVGGVALTCGLRARASNPSVPTLRSLGNVVTGGTTVQLLLGLAAWVTTRSLELSRFEVGVATLHQWFGAALLASAVVLTLWTWRRPPPGSSLFFYQPQGPRAPD
jgi:cytochrome c oxidase assembly protein subunit 15